MHRVPSGSKTRTTITFDPTPELLGLLDEFLGMAKRYWSPDEREAAGFSRWRELTRTQALRVALRDLIDKHTGKGKKGKTPKVRRKTALPSV